MSDDEDGLLLADGPVSITQVANCIQIIVTCETMEEATLCFDQIMQRLDSGGCIVLGRPRE